MRKYKYKNRIAIIFLILCISLSFPLFAGPGEEYRRKLESEKTIEDKRSIFSDAIEFTEKISESNSKEDEERIGKALFKSKVGQSESQVILVLDHKMSLWNKGQDRYYKLKEWKNGYGRKGMKKAEERREGDETSPIGAFPIQFAFGFAEKENTLLPYRQIKKNSVWSGEKSSYNQWVEKDKPVAGEQLWNYKICYEKALAIGFNQNPVVYGRGSAIFLHIKAPSTWESAGCITIEKSSMEELLPLLQEKLSILILQDEEEIKDY